MVVLVEPCALRMKEYGPCEGYFKLHRSILGGGRLVITYQGLSLEGYLL